MTKIAETCTKIENIKKCMLLFRLEPNVTMPSSHNNIAGGSNLHLPDLLTLFLSGASTERKACTKLLHLPAPIWSDADHVDCIRDFLIHVHLIIVYTLQDIH